MASWRHTLPSPIPPSNFAHISNEWGTSHKVPCARSHISNAGREPFDAHDVQCCSDSSLPKKDSVSITLHNAIRSIQLLRALSKKLLAIFLETAKHQYPLLIMSSDAAIRTQRKVL